MRVLILGGNGLLGRILLPKVAESNVVGICDNVLRNQAHTLANGVSSFTADVTDINSLRYTFRKFNPDVIVVSVAHHFNKDIVYSQYEDVSLVIDSINCLSSLLTPNIKKVVFCSSSEVYGGPQTTKKLKESRKVVAPSTHHGVAKLFAESLIKFRCSELGIPLVVLRVFDMYGPRETYCPRTGMINFLVNTFYEGKMCVGLSGAKRRRDFIHVSDVAEAVYQAINLEFTGTYNVGTGKGTTLIELVKLLDRCMSISIPPMLIPDGDVETFSAVADIRKLQEVIPHWKPREVSIETLQEIVTLHTQVDTSNRGSLAEYKRLRGI